MSLSSIIAIVLVAFSVFRRRSQLSAVEAGQQTKDVELAMQYANLFEEQVAAFGTAPISSERGSHALDEVIAWKNATPRVLEALPPDTRQAAAYWMIAEVFARNSQDEMAGSSDRGLPDRDPS